MAACIICGKEFEPRTFTQITCGDKECQRLLKRRREHQQRSNDMRGYKRMNTDLRPKTNWSAIDKKCIEAHKTYGQMVAEGLL